MAYGDDSELIRKRAWEKYLSPKIRLGQKQIAVPIKPLMKEMEAEGFPSNQPRHFCTALQKKAFLREKGLALSRVDGPPSGTSTTVVLHFSVTGDPVSLPPSATQETAEQRAFRLTEKLRGLMKDEIAAHGGTEGFMRWVRSDEEEDAA